MPSDTKSLIEAYERHTPRSREIFEEARRYFPGGDTRASAHYAPYPAVIERGKGCRLWDADGHEYVDFMNNFTSLVHGHGHPGTVEAIREQAEIGTAYAALTPSQVELARAICERVASIEQLRFTSSGSEGTLMGIRAARAFTGRPRVMKMEGGYHGSYDLAEVSLVPLPEQCGPLDRPVSLPVDRSIAPSVLDDVVVAPFNDTDRTIALLEQHAHELACVIVEPVQGSMGMIAATREFLHALREATERLGVVFILDEVITLRLSRGGAQETLDVVPDLTAMGKIIGGGLPIGGIGGRRDIVQVFNPERRDSIMHASTFSGNPLSMVAGAATLDALDGAAYANLNALGERLRAGFNAAFAATGIRGQATGSGSLSQINLTDAALAGPREALAAMIGTGRVSQLIHLGLLRRGIFSAGRLMLCTSTPMGDAEVDAAIAALQETLVELRPVVEKEHPELLV